MYALYAYINYSGYGPQNNVTEPFRSVPVRSVNNDQHNSLVPIPRPIFLIIITAGEKYAVIIISEKSAWGRGDCCGCPIMADVGLPVPGGGTRDDLESGPNSAG